jgi:predicted Zn finger-like uncharacterized protein
MDVTCNRCNTEYEFEEALVSSRGTTVKCTHCGHLFKVQRVANVALAAEAKHWTIRRTDGHTHTLDTLCGLPQLIGDGTFGRDDELSRTGKVWRRLGDIDELDEHFVAADRRGPSRVQSQRQRAQKPAPVTPPAAPVSHAPTPLAAAPSLPPLPRPRRRASTPTAVETAAPSVGGVRHESRRHAWARLLTSAAIVAAIAFWFFSLPPSGQQDRSAQPETPADPSLRFLDAAERALAAYQIDQFDQALVEYGKALGYHEHDSHILSRISRVHALWAEELRSQSKPKPALETQESDAHAQRAKHYAELALQGDPKNSEAQLALSDALRLTGDLPAARSALAGVPASAEMYRVSALLALREARDGDTHKASELAAQAVAADPTLLSARFLLARLLCMQGEPETARAQVAAIAATAPQHPELQRLQSLLAVQAPNVVAEASAKPAANNSEADMLIERAHGMLEAGQLTAARRTFEHVLVLQPGSVAAHAGLGQAAIARGRHLQALDHLVAAALGGDSESLIALAETYRRLGRQREALTAYQSYLQQNPNGAQLELAKSQIERLGEQFASARKP